MERARESHSPSLAVTLMMVLMISIVLFCTVDMFVHIIPRPESGPKTYQSGSLPSTVDHSGVLVMKSYIGSGHWWFSVRPKSGGDVSVEVPMEVWQQARLGFHVSWFVKGNDAVLFSMYDASE